MLNRGSPFRDFLSSRSHSVELDEAAVNPSLPSPPASSLNFLEPQLGSSSPQFLHPELDSASTLSEWGDLPNPVRSVKVEPVDGISGEQTVPGPRKSHKTEHLSISPISSSNDARSAHAPAPPPAPRQILPGRRNAHTPPPLSFPENRHPTRISEKERRTDNPNCAQRVPPSVRPRPTSTARNPSVSPSGKIGRTSYSPLIKVEGPQIEDDLPLPPITAVAEESDDSEYDSSKGEEEKEDSEDELSPSEAKGALELGPEPRKITIKLKRKRDEVQPTMPVQDCKRRKTVQEPASTKPRSKHSLAGRYRCTLDGCQKTFVRKTDLKRHQQMASIHRVAWVDLSCDICSSLPAFSRPDALRRHKRTAKHQRNARLAGLDSDDGERASAVSSSAGT